MDLHDYFKSELADHQAALSELEQMVEKPLADLVGVCAKSLGNGGKIMLFGNGGSAADSQHIATELTVRFEKSRAPMAAMALTTDTSTLTAAGNDYGFEHIFSRQVEAHGRPGDVAIGISTSGNSENVIHALNAAKTADMIAAGLTGLGGGAMKGLAYPLICVPSTRTSRVQEMHILIGHMLCGALENNI